jgi:hypothetical protein
MMLKTLLFLSVILHGIHCIAQEKSAEEFKASVQEEIDYSRRFREKCAEKAKSDPFFPCELASYNGVHRVTIEDGIGYYFELLADQQLYGNGYTWEGIIEKYLEKSHPEILKEIEFDSESSTFVCYCKSVEVQTEFVQIIHELCTNEDQFSNFLKEVDRDRLD